MPEAEHSLQLAEDRRLTTPRREALLAEFSRIQVYCKAVLALEAIVILGLLAFLVMRGSLPQSPLPWLGMALGGLGVFRWFAHHAALNKKRIEDIRPDVQFGIHNRDSLIRLANQVFERLGIQPGSVPVFMTRAKDVNAAAVRCELWPGKHVFNGVFLNRSIVHLLDEPELASVIGHELGHVFPYAPSLSRWYALHAVFAAMVSFTGSTLIPFDGVAFILPLLVLWILDRIIVYPHIRLSRGIEFLCDDFGAEAAGLLPALSVEMKIGAESETRRNLMLPLYEAWKKGSHLNLADLAESYEEAIPFGAAKQEDFQKEFNKLIGSQNAQQGKISLGGFFNHVFGRDDSNMEEAVDEVIAELKLMQALPLLDIDRKEFLQSSQSWTLEKAEQLVSAIEKDPKRLLFQFTEEVNDLSSTHPNASRRILYRWRNRTEYPLFAQSSPSC